ncbi:MAG: 30S ribosomal protein S21 [Chloroflexi bacterium]|nr:30S ribosomal protein S21 [Chloroflexota bacterium]
MAQVILQPDESQESLLRRFRKKVMQARILGEVKKRRYYVPKSEQRRAAKRKARRKELRRRWKEDRRNRN